MLTGSLVLALLCVAVVVIGGTAAVAVEAKHHFIGNALLDMKDSIVLLFKLGKAVVSPFMEELTEDIIEAQKKLALRTLQKDSQDIPGMISSIIGAIHSMTPYQEIDIDLTIPPFSADIPKDIGVTIFPKPILDIPDVESIPATEGESNVIIENPPYIPKSIIDIFPEHVDEGDTIIRMDGGSGVGEGLGRPYSGTRNPSSDFTNAKGKSTLQNHFDRHGSGFNSADDYLNGARNFLEKPTTSTTQSFISNEGTYFRYDTATNEFGIMNKYGGVSTYYKPETGLSYWLEQIELYAPK